MLKNSSQLKTVVIVRGSGECRVLTICRHYARPSVEAIRKLQRAGETRGPSGDPRTTKTTTIKQETPLAAYFPHSSIKRPHWLHTFHIYQSRDIIGCILFTFNKQETSLAVSYPHSTNKRPHWLCPIRIQQTRDLIGCVLSTFIKQVHTSISLCKTKQL